MACGTLIKSKELCVMIGRVMNLVSVFCAKIRIMNVSVSPSPFMLTLKVSNRMFGFLDLVHCGVYFAFCCILWRSCFCLAFVMLCIVCQDSYCHKFGRVFD